MASVCTRRSMCLNVEGFMRNNKFPRGYDIFQDDNGRELSATEALTFLQLEKAKGRKVIPMSSECGSPCSHADKGCAGFDYGGGGCPGYVVPNKDDGLEVKPSTTAGEQQ